MARKAVEEGITVCFITMTVSLHTSDTGILHLPSMQSPLLTHYELRVHAGNDGGERCGAGGTLPKRPLSAAYRRTLRGRLQILGVVPVRNQGWAPRCNGDEGRNAAHRTAHVTDGAVIHTILPGMSLLAFPPHDLSRRVKYLLRR